MNFKLRILIYFFPRQMTDSLDLLIDKLFSIINDKSIKEFDIIDLTPNEEEFIFEESYLALNNIYVKKLYLYLREKFLKRDQLNLTSLERNKITLLFSFIHPQFSSLWSQRKELISGGYVKFESEFSLNNLILNKNCKSELAYIHRRWLVKRQSFPSIQDFVESECDFIFKISKKIKSNYYCWSYLNWLFEYFKDKLVCKQFLDNILAKHQKFVMELSISDYCVFHFRLNCLKLFILEAKIFQNMDLNSLIINEFEIFDDFLFRYSKYQTIWNYRKYFLKIIHLLDLKDDFLVDNLLFKCSFLDVDSIKELELRLSKVDKVGVLTFLINRENILTDFAKNWNKTDFEIVKNYANLHLDFIKKFF